MPDFRSQLTVFFITAVLVLGIVSVLYALKAEQRNKECLGLVDGLQVAISPSPTPSVSVIETAESTASASPKKTVAPKASQKPTASESDESSD